MSTYYDAAINPATGRLELALFIDDYYGKHKYGVQFPGGKVYPASEITVPRWGAKSGEE